MKMNTLFTQALLLGNIGTTLALMRFPSSLRSQGQHIATRALFSTNNKVTPKKAHRLLQPSTFGPGLDVVFGHPLGDALHKLPKVLFEKLSFGSSYDFPLKRIDDIKQGDFGTAFKPNVTAILAAAEPSPFGKGEETVFDESVRRGKELTTKTLSVPEVSEDFRQMIYWSKDMIVKKLFPNAKDVSLRFYKMAIYEAGGHFDFHRDTTHADNHHGTLLLEVKSAHRGGALVFEAEGVEVKGIDFSESEPDEIAAIAFYTDVRHKVEPVTEGTRIVLQYDVLVEKKTGNCKDKDLEQPYLERTGTVDENVLSNPSKLNDMLSVLEETLQKMVAVALQEKSAKECPGYIALPLFHLYREESIVADYLKGVDRELFHALLKTGLYDIALSPIVIESESAEYGRMRFQSNCYSAALLDPIDKIYTGLRKDGRVTKASIGNDHVFNTRKAQYIVSKRESSHEIDFTEPINTGNEAQPAKYKYFLGAILVGKKVKKPRAQRVKKSNDTAC